MKKLIVTACAVIASAVAVASTVQSSNTFGVLKLQASDGTTKKQFFIGVPWEAVGASGATAQKINPKDLVLTTGLKEGDLLIYYGTGDSAGLKAWSLDADNGEWGTAQVASSVAREITTGGVLEAKVYPAAGENDTVTRGEGLLLETKAQSVYLSGQYKSAAPSAVTVMPATSTIKEAYTLIGNYSADTTMIIEASNPKSGDKIFVNNKVYVYNGTEWTTFSQPATEFEAPTWSAADPVVAPGSGAWYLTTSTDNDNDNTITLSTPTPNN